MGIFFNICTSIFLSFRLVKGVSYTNPVVNTDHPDPGVLALPDNAGYVVVSTGVFNGNAYPIMFSTDLVNWEEHGFVFPAGSWPVWATGYMWAPEIHFVNGMFHVYFSGKSSINQRFSIGVAQSTNHFGPFVDLGAPIIEDETLGVIDVHWFKDPIDDKPYLVWKTDDNDIGQAARIFIREVNEDGATFSEDAPTFQILSADSALEANVVEGPWIIFRDPFYYMFYSGNGYMSPHYYTGVARSFSVTGPYEKQEVAEKDVFLHTNLDIFNAGENSTFVGPGHGSAVSVGQDWWFIYHSWRWDHVGEGPGRVLLLDKINWDETSGWPYIGTPSVTSTPGPEI